MDTIKFVTGQSLHWITGPSCGCRQHDGRNVSFRRYLGFETAEVMTCRGSVSVSLGDLAVR